MQPSACLMCLCSYHHVSYAAIGMPHVSVQLSSCVICSHRHASCVCAAIIMCHMQPSACLMCLCSYHHVSYAAVGMPHVSVQLSSCVIYACAAISFYLAQWTNAPTYNYRHASSVCAALAAYVHAVIVCQSNQWYSSNNGMFLVPHHDR